MALTSGTATVTLPTDTQIVITREFDAPKHLVYEAYTTPELVRRWWHANRGEMTICEIDLRVGGSSRYAMVAPDGFEVAFHGEYREIVRDERIVSTEVYEGAWQGDRPEPTLNTATFTDRDGRNDADDPRRGPEQGDPRRDHRVRHGRRSRGRAGSPRAGRRLARVGAQTARVTVCT